MNSLPKILCETCKNCRGFEVVEELGTFYCKCEREGKFGPSQFKKSPKCICEHYEPEGEA